MRVSFLSIALAPCWGRTQAPAQLPLRSSPPSRTDVGGSFACHSLTLSPAFIRTLVIKPRGILRSVLPARSATGRLIRRQFAQRSAQPPTLWILVWVSSEDSGDALPRRVNKYTVPNGIPNKLRPCKPPGP